MTNPTPRDSVQPPSSLMQHALEALEYHQEQTRPIEKTKVAIAALREALRAQAASVEPVAFAKDGSLFWHGNFADHRGESCDLYRAPPVHTPADVDPGHLSDLRYVLNVLKKMGAQDEVEHGDVLAAIVGMNYVIARTEAAPQPQAVAASSPATAVDAVEPSGGEVLAQVFALCEETEDAEVSANSRDSAAAQDFMRGRKFEAKSIRKTIGIWFQDEQNARQRTTAPAGGSDEIDAPTCDDCAGKGWNWEGRQVAERKSDVQEFRIDCPSCDGLGFTGPQAEVAAKERDRAALQASRQPQAQQAVAEGAGDEVAALRTHIALLKTVNEHLLEELAKAQKIGGN